MGQIQSEKSSDSSFCSESEAYVYSNLPVPYLRNLTLYLTNKAYIIVYLGLLYKLGISMG